MAGAKVVVLYPAPKDVTAFEPFHRIAELHFPSMQALQEAAASAAALPVVAHAIAISNGGMPVFLVSEEETRSF